jgi:hypothetical protein
MFDMEEELLNANLAAADAAAATVDAVNSFKAESVRQHKKDREETEMIKKHTKNTFEEVEQTRVLTEEMVEMWRLIYEIQA